jgi:hypothetical protein
MPSDHKASILVHDSILLQRSAQIQPGTHHYIRLRLGYRNEATATICNLVLEASPVREVCHPPLFPLLYPLVRCVFV